MKLDHAKANCSQDISPGKQYIWSTTISSILWLTLLITCTYCPNVSYSGLVTLWLHWLKLLSVLPHSPLTFCPHLILTNKTEKKILLHFIKWRKSSCNTVNMDCKYPNCTMSTKNINWRHLAPEMQNLKQLLHKKYIKMYHSEKARLRWKTTWFKFYGPRAWLMTMTQLMSCQVSHNTHFILNLFPQILSF